MLLLYCAYPATLPVRYAHHLLLVLLARAFLGRLTTYTLLPACLFVHPPTTAIPRHLPALSAPTSA